MSAPDFSVDGVLQALDAQPAKIEGGGRALLLIAARRHEGVTPVARAVAQALSPRPVYAIDLDLKRNALARALSETGALGPRAGGRFNDIAFYELRGAGGAQLEEPTPAFGYHQVARSNVHAGLFDARVLPQQARVVVSPRGDYWDAARAAGASVVVDAPALERSRIGLRVARHMDGVVLVVGADPGAAPAALAAKAALVAAGANLIGLVYAGATAPVMAIERLLRQAV